MKNRTLRDGLIIVVLLSVVGLLIFPPFYQHGDSSNIIYPDYTHNSIIIAPEGYVISNVTNGTGLVYFNLSSEGVISGKWSSNNATVITFFPYTLNKSALQSEINNITGNKTADSKSGVFSNITLYPGKYFMIIGRNPGVNVDVRVVAVTPVVITYSQGSE